MSSEENKPLPPPERPTIVCLCGSTRFKDTFMAVNKEETLRGRIVLSVGYFAHAEDGPPTDEQKKLLDELHLRKIDLAQEVLFLNVDGYLGDSSTRELAYSVYSHKTIRFLDEDKGRVFMEDNSHRIGKMIADFMNRSYERREQAVFG